MGKGTGDDLSSRKRNDEGDNVAAKRTKNNATIHLPFLKNSSDVEPQETASKEINIKTASDKTICVKVNDSDTIGSVKLKIQAQEKIPFEEQELSFNGIVLDNVNTLANLPIMKESLMLMCKSVELMELFVTTHSGNTVSLSVKPTHTISDVKLLLVRKLAIPWDQQVLIFNKLVLGDSGTLFDFSINTKSTLMLLRKARVTIRLFIKTLNGEIITLDVKPSDTIETIKGMISMKVSIARDEQELIFNGMVLDNDDTLADYQIKQESTLTLMRFSSGFMRVFIETGSGKTISLDVKPSDTLHQLKVKIFNSEGFRPCEQRLIWEGKQLLDDATVADYHIPKESIIHVVLRLRGC
ncbi:hypothetical protein QVD17_03958 [Tagetes erecta]|uniref:Ubiquitin-like domain-containing protein n=1 Tax=Tagetes erecta TaxID=13708 RepID=A0AAD8L999_TARER|nr:hypothetical protein QVD17_03958 [Tagetes erecta]